MKIKIDLEKCCWKESKCESSGCSGGNCGEGNGESNCEGCVEMCPVQAIERKEIVEIDQEKCISCGACITSCPKGALAFDE